MFTDARADQRRLVACLYRPGVPDRTITTVALPD
jgi:hypothetical protein